MAHLNEKIARFMDVPVCDRCPDCGYFKMGSGIYYKPEDMGYATSWDWLMEVVDKIHGICEKEGECDHCYVVTIEPKYCVISKDGESPVVEVQFDEYDQKGLVYEAVTRFIELYQK